MPEIPDPRAYLMTEARIIAEDDIYAVIAVRVEKALLARNLPFLAALVDRIPSESAIAIAKATGAG